MRRDPRLSPGVVRDFGTNVHAMHTRNRVKTRSADDSSSECFIATICTSLLLGLKTDVTEVDGVRDDFETLRAKCKSEELQSLNLADQLDQHLQETSDFVDSCLENLTLGHLSAWVHGNLRKVLLLEIEMPTVPTFVHVYLYYVYRGNPPLPTLEKLCTDFESLLFWKGRPTTVEG